MKRGPYLFILLQKYAHYVIHVCFNTYLLMFVQSPNFYVKKMCIMQNIVKQLLAACQVNCFREIEVEGITIFS